MNRRPYYTPGSPAQWFGRVDADAPGARFHESVTCAALPLFEHSGDCPTLDANSIVLMGYCSDAGIIRNQGRPGASMGPASFRALFGGLATLPEMNLIDAGDIYCEDDALEQAQDRLAQAVHFVHQSGAKTLLIGGGHDIAWGHYQGLAKAYPGKRIGIVNFDAHLDMRALVNDQGSSGTPFLQIAESSNDFAYCCIGMQASANTHVLIDTAKRYNTTILSAEDCLMTPDAISTALDEFIWDCDILYLTVCLDCFAESVAPGVSAPQALGLMPSHVLPWLRLVASSGKLVAMDIAELSPPFDQEAKTARLAAALARATLSFSQF